MEFDREGGLGIFNKLRVFTGSSNVSLVQMICEHLGIPLGKAQVKKFSDGEINVEINESVRGMDVFAVQSTCPPVNDHLMELLILIDALKRASAARINAVIPYYGYARQDKKVLPRAPISAKLVADLITAAGASRILTIELHASQIQGFFNIPVDHLYASPILLDYLGEQFQRDLVIVSPDAGGVERARAFAKRLNVALAIIDKRRDIPNVAKAMHIIGDVRGKNSILLDDMVDTAGTLFNAAFALKEEGAENVYAYCTHPVLSGRAVDRLMESPLQEVIVTDTIPLRGESVSCKKLKVLTVAPLLAEAIKRIHLDESVSSLFV
ncbi:MAG: ribose-phosphate pyrophosphokinase [Syntrophobacterales bacterium]|nr:MAG: ribose-phosphate pyrophosphokinase [Syntrophobacterales bacterium]